MDPSDLSLPPKFSSWYPRQEDTLIRVACSPTRVTVLDAPPGVGKSAIYMGAASLLEARAICLTLSKPLQQQLIGDFSPMGLREIKGQNNYPCRYFEDSSRRRLPGCDEGPCHAGIECRLRSFGCDYYDAVARARRSQLVVTNYSYWMSMQRYGEPDPLDKVDLLILDEAHEAARQLSEFVKITIHRPEVHSLLSLDCPPTSDIHHWVEWAEVEALPVCRSKLEAAISTVSMYRHGISVVRRLRELENHLQDLVKARDWRRSDAPDPATWIPGSSTDWLIEDSGTHVTFSPVWASAYAEEYLFAGIPRILMVSATVTRRDAHYLGVRDSDITYIDMPSPFPRRIRPVLVVDSASVGRNMTIGEERIWMRTIDSIIEAEGDVKGIIHAVSYDRARLIYARSRFKDRMIFHDRRGTHEAVRKFKASSPPSILVSPSVSTGFDFPMDQARYQIIAKIPFIDFRSEVVRARCRADKRYLNYTAIMTIIQMAGRGVRSVNDYCRTYIVDDNWSRWFYTSSKDLIPKWFKQAVRRVTLSEIRSMGKSA